MKFETSKAIDKWIKDHKEIDRCRPFGTAGEQFMFEFLPTGIIECQTVKCVVCGKKFTDYID